MALFPCDGHGGPYPGPQQTAYPALVNGTSQQREKRRLCPHCFTTLHDVCDEYLHQVGDADFTDGCVICHAEDTPYSAFVTLYATAREREDYFGKVCAGCAAEPVRQAFFGVREAL